MDALDPSAGMLEHARSRNIYKNITVDSIYPEKNNSVEDGNYLASPVSPLSMKL